MKYSLAIVFSILCAASAFADDTCESAVDAAASMDVNRKDCDYTNEGLNGVLQRVFKRGKEGAVLETTEESSSENPAGNTTEQQPTRKPAGKIAAGARQFLLNVEVDQWANVPAARNQLLPKAMAMCEQGFTVVQETYQPLSMGRIGLVLSFKCR